MCMLTGADIDFFFQLHHYAVRSRNSDSWRSHTVSWSWTARPTPSGTQRPEISFHVAMQERRDLITAQKTNNQKIRHGCLPHGSARTQALHSPLRNQRNQNNQKIIRTWRVTLCRKHKNIKIRIRTKGRPFVRHYVLKWCSDCTLLVLNKNLRSSCNVKTTLLALLTATKEVNTCFRDKTV